MSSQIAKEIDEEYRKKKALSKIKERNDIQIQDKQSRLNDNKRDKKIDKYFKN